ncbi:MULTISPECIES: ABC transporter permease [Micrococcaceae]|uniref:ABC transporter permease n=1 Tax=unclassified Kocuria TaxID=2649579 RepID=UPI00101393F4|nr:MULTISPECIES: ABC transporter permease [unclassified Kocuria]
MSSTESQQPVAAPADGLGATPEAQSSPSPVTPPWATGPEKPSLAYRITSSPLVLSAAALIAALVVGGLLIIFTDQRVLTRMNYFFNRPSDTFEAAWKASSTAYAALFEGAIFNPHGGTFVDKIYPLTETLTIATPLIFAGLGVAISFRSGLFNIGAQGQIILGAIVAGYIGFSWHLPMAIHLLLVVLGGVIGGAIWGGLVGLLKAKTGAHEVILCIMLNYVALNLVLYVLTTPGFQRPGSTNPISPQIDSSAQLPKMFGDSFRLHWGFVLAILAVLLVSWMINRSTIGFRLRAVGANPEAAKSAGINVTAGYIIVMLMSGGLSGMAGVSQISGTEKVLTGDVAASFGFDAITVALLGRSTPWGTFWAGLLYGAFRAGGVAMQTNTGTNINIVLVVQSLIVLFIAAPPLVRAIFRLPDPSKTRKAKRRMPAARKAGATQ